MLFPNNWTRLMSRRIRRTPRRINVASAEMLERRTVPTVNLSAQAVTAAPQPKHHSKIKGALAGAAAGHMLGGHAKSGAVVGAMVQHHRNKKAAAAMKP